MAVGTGIGFDLSFLDKLDEADKKLDQFIKTSQGMSSKVIKSWQDIAVNGIDPFLQKMKDQKTALESIANMDLSVKVTLPYSALSHNATKTNNDDKELIWTLSQEGVQYMEFEFELYNMMNIYI